MSRALLSILTTAAVLLAVFAGVALYGYHAQTVRELRDAHDTVAAENMRLHDTNREIQGIIEALRSELAAWEKQHEESEAVIVQQAERIAELTAVLDDLVPQEGPFGSAALVRRLEQDKANLLEDVATLREAVENISILQTVIEELRTENEALQRDNEELLARLRKTLGGDDAGGAKPSDTEQLPGYPDDVEYDFTGWRDAKTARTVWDGARTMASALRQSGNPSNADEHLRDTWRLIRNLRD